MGVPTNGRKTITHTNPKRQHHQLQVGKSVPMVATGYCRHKSLKRCRRSIGHRAPTASGDREQDIPDWLHPFTEGLVEGESDHPAVLVKQFPQHFLRIYSSETLEHGLDQKSLTIFYWICLERGDGGWRKNHTSQLKPKTYQATQQPIISTPDMHCTSRLSALTVPCSGNTEFQWQSRSHMASNRFMKIKNSPESWLPRERFHDSAEARRPNRTFKSGASESETSITCEEAHGRLQSWSR